MTVKKCMALLLAILVIFGSISGQVGRPANPRNVRVNRSLPSVYISFEKQDKKRLWFRFNNNMIWPMWLNASGEEKGFGDAELFYDVLDKDGIIVNSNKCHVCSIVPLQKGKTILFSIPKEMIRFQDDAIRIMFFYEWEVGDEWERMSEPVHYAYISMNDIVKKQEPRP